MSDLRAGELKKLLHGYVGSVDDDTATKLELYLKLLLKWNARTNLTAIRGPEDIARRHFGESLSVAEYVGVNLGEPGKRLYDLGSGAGFPGVLIALWCPNLRVTLIESQGKKATFLREVVRALSLKNCVVFAGRAESLHTPADVVTMRAVDRAGEMRAVAEKLLVPRGTLLQMLGANQLFEGQVEQLSGGVRLGVAVVK